MFLAELRITNVEQGVLKGEVESRRAGVSALRNAKLRAGFFKPSFSALSGWSSTFDSANPVNQVA